KKLTTPGCLATTTEVLNALDSENQWARETAFRLILENRNSAYTSGLIQLVKGSNKAETRAAALWLLNHLGALNEEILTQSVHDPHSGVREQVVELAGANKTNNPGKVLDVCDSDSDQRVRFKTALALGNLPGTKSVEALAKIAAQDGEDKWSRNAVLSGITGRLSEFLEALRKQNMGNARAYALIMQGMGRLFGNAASAEACRDLLEETLHQKGGED